MINYVGQAAETRRRGGSGRGRPSGRPCAIPILASLMVKSNGEAPTLFMRLTRCGDRRVLARLAMFVALLMVLGAAPGALVAAQDAAGGARRAVPNTWAAASSAGLKLAGTWTATEDQKTGTVTGTWTVFDGQGRTAASGAWSAAKAASGWTGSWRAVAAGRTGEYSGTWSARVDLKGTARFSDLFAKAIETAVSGTWRASGQSGAWTIQVFK